MSKKPLTELQIQIRFLKWLSLHYSKTAAVTGHIPNSAQKNIVQQGLFKQAGLRRGLPDLMVFQKMLYRNELGQVRRYHGLALEIKKNAKCYPSPEQRSWLCVLNDLGWAAVCPKGLEQTQAMTRCYLETPHKMRDHIIYTYDRELGRAIPREA